MRRRPSASNSCRSWWATPTSANSSTSPISASSCGGGACRRPPRIFQHSLAWPRKWRADRAFAFIRASQPRTDLDTISVRTGHGQLVSWAEYMREAQVRAFLVIRHDTILYERYLAGYTDSTRSGSYSMAKSFTSALLGIA